MIFYRLSLTVTYALSLALILFLTSKYMPIEGDVANSPIVWRELGIGVIEALRDWKPTIDNWYFTVYPINFIFFAILGDDGKLPLILTTSLFSFAIVIFSAKSIKQSLDVNVPVIFIFGITLLHASSYNYGFVAHPFSHNSTNAFGFICIFICMMDIKQKTSYGIALISLLSLCAVISDPWYLASFLIPIAITYLTAFFYTKEKRMLISLASCVIVMIIYSSGLIQSFLHIPTHKIEIVSINQIKDNISHLIFFIGSLLDIFIISSKYTAILSFAIWMSLSIFTIYYCYRMGFGIFLPLVMLLSIAGIISSYAITSKINDSLSPRFFMNITCAALLLCGILMAIGGKRLKIISTLLMCLFIATSIRSYVVNYRPVVDQTEITQDLIKFLNQNNLTYGYGSFWRYAATVNWLSKGDVFISPVYFSHTDGTVDFKSVRAQTFAHWKSDGFINKSPKRQFIIISENSKDSGQCPRIQMCFDGIGKQIGEPDQVLRFKDMFVLVFNHRII